MKKILFMSAFALTSFSYANAATEKENTSNSSIEVRITAYFGTPTRVTYQTSCGTTYVETYPERPSDAQMNATLQQHNEQDCGGKAEVVVIA